MTLDAFRPFFGSISTPCTCEVSIFTTQTTSVLHIQQEPSVLPTSNCGLSMKLTWGTQHSRVVNCNNYLDTEYQLDKGGVLMLTLNSTSPTWSTGFCLAVRLRFGEYIKTQQNKPTRTPVYNVVNTTSSMHLFIGTIIVTQYRLV